MKKITHNRRNFLTIAGGVACMGIVPGMTFAQIADSKQVVLRIDMADRLAMLSQRVAKATSLIRLGVAKQDKLAQLKQSHDEFDDIMLGFQEGQGNSGVLKERIVRVQLELDKVMTLWQPMRGGIEDILASGDVDDEHFELIASTNIPLKDECHTLILALHAAYDGKVIDPKVGLTIEMAGRQEMLTQEMAKELTLISLDYEADKNREYFQSSSRLFGQTVNALIAGESGGLPIIDPPTEAAMTSLQKVKQHWIEMADTVNAVNGGAVPDAATVEEFAYQSESLLHESEDVIHEYEKLYGDSA